MEVFVLTIKNLEIPISCQRHGKFSIANPLLQVHQDSIKFATPWQDGTNLTTLVSSYGNFIPNVFKKGATAADLKAAMKQADQDANSKISK